MHAYIYARRRRNLAILRIMTIIFLGFSNAAFIFFTFSHLLDFTFSHLLYFTFSHLLYSTFSRLLDFTVSHLLYSTFLHLYIFTSFAFLSFCILHFSLLSFLLWSFHYNRYNLHFRMESPFTTSWVARPLQSTPSLQRFLQLRSVKSWGRGCRYYSCGLGTNGWGE